MKNITISVDDELYRQARVKAAESSTSLSAMFREYLVEITGNTQKKNEFQRLQREEEDLRAELRSRRISLNPAYHLSRAELHDRHAIR